MCSAEIGNQPGALLTTPAGKKKAPRKPSRLFTVLMVDLTRFELVTSRLSAGRSNQLSYRSIAGINIAQRSVARQQLFFQTPKFFSERAARISPRRRSGNLSRPLLAVNRFLLLFSKNLFAPPSRPLGPARLSETFRPAAAKTVYAPPRRLCQRLFIFFLIFFFTPGNAPLTSGV